MARTFNWDGLTIQCDKKEIPTGLPERKTFRREIVVNDAKGKLVGKVFHNETEIVDAKGEK